MKKFILSIVLLAGFSINTAKAQLKVVNDGRVEIACSDDDTADSRFAVGGGQSGFVASFKGNSLNSSGLYAEAGVPTNNSWMIGIKGRSYLYDNNLHKVGVYGDALQGAGLDIGRSYGVYGVAGNATSGWNYGVCGVLAGSKQGAGVYGTTDNLVLGVYGKYAGYFRGQTKVVGSLNVTGSITGTLLTDPFNMANCQEVLEENSFADRIGTLQAVSFYQIEDPNEENIITGDTACIIPELSLMEKQKLERIHYGIKTEQLKETFPELVYEQENGNIKVNYVELIPVLVQTINELNQRISILEGRDVKKASAANSHRVDEEPLTVHSSSTSSETTVSYRLPSGSKSAELLVCDLSGQVKKVVNVPKGKSNSFSFPTDGLENGIYMYSLIVDGDVYATKRMVVKH